MKTIIRNFVIVRNVIPTGQHAASVWPLKNCILLITILLTVTCANAADLVWTGGTGNWNAAGNWSPAQVPTAADNAWITNSGTYTVTVPAGTSAVASTIAVGGASGTQTLAIDRAILTVGGASVINANGHLDFLVSQSVLTGAGNLTVNGTLNWANGTMSGTGTTTIGSGGMLAIGSGGVTFGRTLNNAGTGSWSGGNLTMSAGVAFNNLAGGTFDITADGRLSGAATTPVNNTGLFRQTAGTVSTIVTVPFNNSGTLQVLAATLSLNLGGTNTGTMSNALGATLNFGGGSHVLAAGSLVTGTGVLSVGGGATTLTASGNFDAGSTLSVAAGNVTLASGCNVTGAALNLGGGVLNYNSAGSVATVNLTAGSLGGISPVTVTGPLTLGGGTITNALVIANGGLTINGSVTLNGGKLVNPGTAIWNAGNFTGANGAVFSNLFGATFDNTFDGNAQSGAGAAPIFVNAGSFRKTGATAPAGTTSIDFQFINTGTVEVQTNTLRYAFNQQTAGQTILDGGGLSAQAQPIQLLGGSLVGPGLVTVANLQNVINSAAISPGLPLGELDISGNYQQTASGMLNIELGGYAPGTNFDLVTVTAGGAGGVATLGGTLNITLTNGFSPTNGATFTFLTAVSRVGAFTAFNYPSNDIGMQLVLDTISASVKVTNLKPVVTNPVVAPAAVTYEAAFNFQFPANTFTDPDGDSLTYTASGMPPGITFTGSTRTFSGNPSQAGVFTVTVVANDGGVPNLIATNSFNITVNPVDITGSFTAADKIYDGNTNAIVQTRTPNGVLPADSANVTLTGGTASFANATVGVGKTVTLTGATLTGSAATNYNLTSVSSTTASISALGITGSFTPADKIYDGNTNAAVLSRTPNGVLPADIANVTLSGGTASFANATVGVSKTVTLTGATLTGSAAGNYNLTSVGTTTASITALGITGSFTAADKIYDGNTNANVVLRIPNGVLPADIANVTLTGGTASFANATIGAGKTVMLTGATLTGSAATNYNLTSVSNTTASITALGITGSFTAPDKIYDGNTNAAVLTRTANGVLPTDTANVTLTGGTASFANATVGTGKTVTLTGATLTGTAAINYNLTSVSNSTASITALGIAGNFTAADKIYDGNTNANVVSRIPNGVLAGDTANVTLSGGIASFANATVGAGKTVTLTGATLTGTAATNYNLISVSNTTASITALGITGSFTAADKIYDGNTNANVLSRTPNGVLPADSANVTLSGGIASFANATVGAGKTVTLTGATLTGTAATNYNLISVSNTTASITALGITGSFTAADKIYDGNTNANVVLRIPNGVLSADTANVTLGGGAASFANAAVGAGKTVTLTGATLTGTAATNYNLTSVSNTTASITALGITGSFTAADKIYDGNPNANVLSRTPNGVLAADAANVTLSGGTASFANATVGAGKTVTLTGATLTGSAATNYNLTSVSNSTASITAAALSITANPKTKTFGAADPAFTVAYAGFVNSETPAVLGGTLIFNRAPSEAVGNYLITPSGLTSANYAIAFNTGTLAITAPAPLLLPLTHAGTTNIAITWSAVSNGTYRVQFSPVLNTTNWTDLAGDVVATGNTASKTDTMTTTNRFYRVRVLP